ncbi:MAG: YhbY family RNA-binding protein [Burkholderiales bacterium]|jgi:putative YhbY family RNA-binding protein|nr:YhbY family RNA-binding protein [Burkholderiales bacterium]
MLTLTSTERRALRAQAHALSPVVIIGQNGLTPSVLREIDHALNAHELIKVRIFNDERAEREALQLAVCHQLACAPVQHLGKLIVLWRPAPPKKEETPKSAKRPAKKAAKKTAKKALPGAISRHGQAIKPLSARQARQQTQQPAWQSRDTGETSFAPFAEEPSSNRRRSPRSTRQGSRGFSTTSDSRSSHKTSGKSTFPQTKPSAKSPIKQPARQPRNPYSAPRSANRRRLGGRGKV